MAFDVTNAISHATCTTAHDLGAKAIVTVTKGGGTARQLSKFRPLYPIVGCTTQEHVWRQLNLSWGVVPMLIDEVEDTDVLFDRAVDAAERLSDIPGRFRDGDILVVPETNNTIVEYLRRCSGIITEEGGANTHAAIVGLAMDKPVLTGAQHATELLKSGAVVCLDAKAGRVTAC